MSSLLVPLVLAAAPPSPQEYYGRALAVMRALPEPSKITESVTAVGNGIGVYAGPSNENAHDATFQGGTNLHTSTTSWYEIFDTASGEASVDTQSASGLIGKGPMFNPTWSAAYDWLRYGLAEPPPKSASSAPVSDSSMKTIATLTVLAPEAYVVTDAGPQPCPDGTPGHHLQFAARTDIVRHPLTDVTVDQRTMRFCSIGFRFDSQHVHGGTATAELHFANVDGYWLQTDSHIDIVARAVGVALARAHITVSYHYRSVQ